MVIVIFVIKVIGICLDGVFLLSGSCYSHGHCAQRPHVSQIYCILSTRYRIYSHNEFVYISSTVSNNSCIYSLPERSHKMSSVCGSDLWPLLNRDAWPLSRSTPQFDFGVIKFTLCKQSHLKRWNCFLEWKFSYNYKHQLLLQEWNFKAIGMPQKAVHG